MLDIKFIRENKDLVTNAAKNKNVDIDINHVLEIDTKYRELLQAVENLRSERNRLAKEKNIEEGKKLKVKLEKEEHALLAVKEELQNLLMKIPNVPLADTPLGKDESSNVEIKKIGNIPAFSFKVRDHLELGDLLEIINMEKASRIVGSRFVYLLGEAALLEVALLQYTFHVLQNEKILQEIADKIEKGYSAKPFIPVIPPVMIKPEVFKRMARLDPGQEEERYHLQKDDLYLIGSAEHTLGSLHMDETISEEKFPIRYVGFSSSFRREAGSYGKDIRGMLRVHQFDKIEMESFTLLENSRKEQDFIVSIQEYLVQSLKLPYRVMNICTGDMGAPDARQIDIETWIPSQNKYRETHTSDLMTDYQARRLNTKVKRKNNEVEFAHMNDATAFAIGRIIIAILENYQKEDGTVIVPEVLQKYTGFDKILPKKK